MGFLRSVAFPASASLLSASGGSMATLVSGARCRVHSITVRPTGALANGHVRLRSLLSNTDVVRFEQPTGAGDGNTRGVTQFLGGMLFEDGVRLVADAAFTGSVTIEELPRVGQVKFSTSMPLDQVRTILGKSTPHPLNGLTKWGTFPGETGTNETWATASDSELFSVTLPHGFTREGSKRRLVVLHHHLSNSPDSALEGTSMAAICAERGYVVLAPTSLLTDNWPGDYSSDSLEALISWCVQLFNINPDDINFGGFSLGGQAAIRFTATHRDPAGIMLRTVMCCEPTLDMLVWWRKQWNNTSLGQSVPPVPGPATLLCDPAPAAGLNTVWRAQVERHDNMDGPWPGSEGASAVSLRYRASGVLALTPASYAESGALVSLAPVNPPVSVADLSAATVDANRSSIASALWTPMLMFYGTDSAVTVIPPLMVLLAAHLAAINPAGVVGLSPTIVNVGAWGGAGSHTWDIVKVGQWLDWIDQQPPTIRLPSAFEIVGHQTANPLSYGNLLKTSANDMARARVVAGASGFTISSEFNAASVELDVSKSPLVAFNFGAGTPLNVVTASAHLVCVRNLPHAPVGASGTNVGVVSIPSLAYPGDPNSITIAPTGAGAMTIAII